MPNYFTNLPAQGPYAQQQAEIQRRQKMAELLQKQSMEPIQAPQGGRLAAPISPLNVFSKMYQGYVGGQQQQQAEEKQKALAEQMQAERNQVLARAIQASQAQPAQPMQMDAADNVQTPATPAMPASPMRGLEELGKSKDPTMLAQYSPIFNMQAKQQEAEETRKFRASESAEARASRESMATEGREQRAFDAAAQRAQRMQELTMRLSDQRLAAQDRAALQRELAMMRADQQRSESELRRASSPQAIKEREKVAGKESLDSLLDELESDYKSYQELGADIDPSRSSVGNIANRIASSGVGQLVGGAVGTKEQEIRDSINQKRASLMAALKQATGMGATQLNSNVELQFYLRMATDPTMARSANQKAIKWLRDTYGIGGGAAPQAPAAPGAPQGAPAAGGQGWSIRPLP